LHANAGGGRGFESFIYSDLGAKDKAVEMQKVVHGEVMSALNHWEIVDRGLKRAVFYVLRHNPYPAVLIESLFLDNARESAIWREPPFVEALAAGVARGIKASLGLTEEGNSPSLEPSLVKGEGELYIVHVGAFAYIENARQRLAEAQQAGFSDAYIYQRVNNI